MSTTKRFNKPRSLRAAITRTIKLLTPEYAWTKLYWVKNVPNVPGNPTACAYCLDGALAKACTGDANAEEDELLTKARKLVAKTIKESGYAYQETGSGYVNTVIRFNDFSERVKGEVLDVLNEAREAA